MTPLEYSIYAQWWKCVIHKTIISFFRSFHHWSKHGKLQTTSVFMQFKTKLKIWLWFVYLIYLTYQNILSCYFRPRIYYTGCSGDVVNAGTKTFTSMTCLWSQKGGSGIGYPYPEFGNIEYWIYKVPWI